MMRKIILLFVMITLALGVFAQSKGKNAMTLRLVDIKVTDGALVNIAKEQEAKGNTKPMDMIRIYEGNVRAKLDEVAKASGRFEISDENTLDALTRDALEIEANGPDEEVAVEEMKNYIESVK